MWWDHQNLNKPHIDATGKRWNFRVWHDVASGGHAERIFFWDDRKEFCGVVVLPVGKAVHISKIKALIRKLVADPSLRTKFRREIQFPLERHYAEYGVFPEETSDGR